MEFQLGGKPEKSGNRSRPQSHKSTGLVQLRLMTLFAMLVIVLIAMKEAAKPQTWVRLGFGAAAENVEPNPKNPASIEASTDSQVAKNNMPESAFPTAEIGNVNVFRPSKDTRIFSDVSSSSDQFWLDVFDQLKPAGQRALFRMLRQSRSDQPISGDQKVEFEDLLSRIEKMRRRHESGLSDRLATEADRDRKKRLEVELGDDRQFWASAIQAIRRTISDTELTREDRETLEHVQVLLDRKAFEQVVDQTAMNRAIEGSAWLRAWELTMIPNTETVGEITRVQMTSQPGAYRGERVSIKGRIRAAEKIKVRRNELGVDSYFVLWVQQNESPLAPFCIYCLELPDRFPEVTSQLKSMDEQVEISGIFFKLRSYLAGDEQVEGSPLVLAKTFQWNQKVAAESGRMSLNDTYWWLGRGLIVCLVVSIALAFFAYKSTHMRRFEFGQKRTEGINASLDQLADDPQILSDRERIVVLENQSMDQEA